MEPRPSTCEKDGKGCIHLRDNKSCDRYEGQHNNQSNPARHAELSPHTKPPSEPPSLMSSHASSPSSSSSTSEPFFAPSCDLTDGTFGSTMVLSSSQKETKEEESKETDSRGGGRSCPNETDSRGGGHSCPNKTSAWRSLNKAGTGEDWKSPMISHWQASENL